MKNINRRIGGKKAQAYGAQFERLIDISCKRYANQGLAYIEKTPEPFNMIKRQGARVLGYYEKKGQPDFAGTLKGGRSVVFEAKHTNTTNIPFSQIEDHQEEALEKHEQLGAECFILVAFGLKTYYKVHWSDWKELKRTIGKKSLNEKDLAEYKITNKKGLINFLEE